MTYSVGDDALMGHTFNGDEVFYTYIEDSKLPPAPPQGDRCLGSLPAVGGSRQFSLCGSPIGDADSAKVFHAGTRLADGSLVFVYSTRRLPTVAVPLNGALYIQRPGEHRWTTLIEYPYEVISVIPHAILAAGPNRVVTLGAGGTELVTISADNGVTRRQVGALSGVDAVGGYGLRVADGMIRRVNLDSGAESDLLAVPAEGDWSESTVLSISVGAGVVALGQWLPGAGSRVVTVREGAQPLVAFTSTEDLGRISVSPDGRSMVLQVGGDLYRYPIP